jgi:hypothetical protein
VLLAIQDKAWVNDPDGNEWEVFAVLKDNLPKGSRKRLTRLAAFRHSLMSRQGEGSCDSLLLKLYTEVSDGLAEKMLTRPQKVCTLRSNCKHESDRRYSTSSSRTSGMFLSFGAMRKREN